MTTSQNTAAFETFDHVLAGIPIASSQAINEGDLVCWDSTLNSGAGGLRVVASQADMATYMGVADAQNPVNSLDANVNKQNSLKIRRGGIVKLYTTAAETYHMFDTVYFNETADAQTIVKSNGAGARTVGVGVIILPPSQVDQQANFAFTGAAGVQITVWLTPKFPVATI